MFYMFITITNQIISNNYVMLLSIKGGLDKYFNYKYY